MGKNNSGGFLLYILIIHDYFFMVQKEHVVGEDIDYRRLFDLLYTAVSYLFLNQLR